ncbi:MAG: hypothetical protein ACYC3I_19515 [Gemmataceae bacterium]
MLLMNVAVNAVMQDDGYYQTHGWPKLLGLWIAAAVTWPLGRLMNRHEEKQLLDPETGDTVIVRSGGGHSLFFIPVEYWAVIFLILGVMFLFV